MMLIEFRRCLPLLVLLVGQPVIGSAQAEPDVQQRIALRAETIQTAAERALAGSSLATLPAGVQCLEQSHGGTTLALAAECLETLRASAAEDGPTGIEGVVTDLETGDPLADVIVTLGAGPGIDLIDTSTDADGHYAFPSLPFGPGYYWVAAEPQPAHPDHLGMAYPQALCGRAVFCTGPYGTPGMEPIAVDAGATVTGIDFALPKGGSIEGTVVDAQTDNPIEHATVFLANDLGTTTTDSNGHYQFRGVVPGPASVYAAASGHVQALHPSHGCLDCNDYRDTDVNVVANSAITSVDLALSQGTVIFRGIVRNASSGEPVTDTTIGNLRDPAGIMNVKTVRTDAEGGFEVEVPRGRYPFFIRHGGYVREYWGGGSCAVPCPLEQATLFELRDDAVEAEILLRPEVPGEVHKLSGHVHETDTGRVPLLGLVEAYQKRQELIDGELRDRFVTVTNTFVFADGYYELSVPPGQYWVVLDYSPGPWFPTAHDGSVATCVNTTCDLSAISPIVVGSEDVSDVDFEVQRGPRIRGRMTGTGGKPVGAAFAVVRDEQGLVADFGRTDYQGRYVTSMALPPGSYTVQTNSVQPYVWEVFDNIPCPRGRCHPTAVGTPVVIAPNDGPGDDKMVDFELGLGATITGTVTSLSDDLPFVGVTSRIFNEAGEIAGTPRVGYDGIYRGSGLAAGRYYAETDTHILPFNNQIYRDVVCAADTCTPTVGTPVDLAANAVATADIVLGDERLPCATGGPDLCVQNQRFRVEVSWDSNDDSGTATVFPITNDSGAFWFFKPANLELLTKVLDGCSFNGHFWVFIAGLTNVGVEIAVTDTWTGETKTYSNTRGMAFDTVTDTHAFGGCPF